MLEALRIWKTVPTEIESDLSRFHRRRIGDWHLGQMSSRELLALLDNLPDDSQFKRYAAAPYGRGGPWGGDWSKAEYIQARIARELQAARGVYEFTGLLSPRDEWFESQSEAAQNTAIDSVRSVTAAMLRGEVPDEIIPNTERAPVESRLDALH